MDWKAELEALISDESQIRMRAELERHLSKLTCLVINNQQNVNELNRAVLSYFIDNCAIENLNRESGIFISASVASVWV
jgi:hypothetical protein